jgi:hypothetical protein
MTKKIQIKIVDENDVIADYEFELDNEYDAETLKKVLESDHVMLNKY